MDFDVKSFHIKRKVFTECSICFKGRYSECKKCRGPCIFSKALFDACAEDQSFRSMIKSEYYKEDFHALKSLIMLHDPSLEELLNEEGFANYNLLAIYHQKKRELKLPAPSGHSNDYSFNRKADHSDLALNRPRVKGRCWWHKTANKYKHFDTFGVSEKPFSRNIKKVRLMKESEDFTVND